jgi:hypothetical protein
MNTSFSDSASPATACHVTREANLIARNLECLGAQVAAKRTAEHIGRFWAPQLRATLFEQARNHPERFGPIAGEAIAMLRESSA